MPVPYKFDFWVRYKYISLSTRAHGKQMHMLVCVGWKCRCFRIASLHIVFIRLKPNIWRQQPLMLCIWKFLRKLNSRAARVINGIRIVDKSTIVDLCGTTLFTYHIFMNKNTDKVLAKSPPTIPKISSCNQHDLSKLQPIELLLLWGSANPNINWIVYESKLLPCEPYFGYFNFILLCFCRCNFCIFYT